MDQEESLSQHVAKRSQRGSRLRQRSRNGSGEARHLGILDGGTDAAESEAEAEEKESATLSDADMPRSNSSARLLVEALKTPSAANVQRW
ncbi:hypothetical protein [Paraburkholderia ginsengisoli]|uniref:Uncharacterized protein n=1 Tax=Paraburkholderia ginsengisoli TaxID=311231 RepID=A0A7T4TB80_9BURK|nr:hypothetical protein I6I06_18385 [Paraburkholderia ginsengisoli]